MTTKKPVSTKPQLEYRIRSTPAPLVTGATGGFEVIGTNPSDAKVEIGRILLAIPIGDNATSLCEDLKGADIPPPNGWSVTPSGGSLMYTPSATGGFVAAGSALTLQVDGFTSNQAVGQVALTLLEEGAGPNTSAPHQVDLPLVKVAPGLEIEYFTAKPENVAPGGSATLEWQGSAGASYVITYPKNKIENVAGQPGTPLPNSGSYTIDNIVAGTTFTLTAKKAGHAHKAKAETRVSLVEAKIHTFATDPEKPLIGQPVTVTWTASGASVTLDPGGHLFPSKSGAGQTGSFTMTPTAEKTTFTLTAY